MDIRELIKSKSIVLTDGSMGTYLEQLGYKGKTPELAVFESPELVKRVHREYIEAGAQIILTDTFGANNLRLFRKKIEGKFGEINAMAVQIASDVRTLYDKVLIAGDIGPTGEILEPYGNLTKKEAGRVFSAQSKVLCKSGVDFILLETFQDLEELKTAFYSIREKTDVFVLPSITLNTGIEYRTLMGQKIEDVVEFIERENIGIMGVNCGIKSKEMLNVVRRIRKISSSIALWIKPNAGIPEISAGNMVYPETKEEFTDNCMEIVRYGVNFIGGCCGTTPEYIKLLKKKVK